MTTARDIMIGDAECASTNHSLVDVARRFRALGLGALRIRGADNRRLCLITDRDIVVKCVAAGGDPILVKVSEVGEGKTVTIGTDDPVKTSLRTMSQHGVGRLPVIDGRELIGVLRQADVAKNLPEKSVVDLVGASSSAHPSS